MEKSMKKSQVVKLFLIAALLFITPLLSTSLRSTYLYFILNILILVVCSESGLLSFFLDTPENAKPAIIADQDKQNHGRLLWTLKSVQDRPEQNTGGSDKVEVAVEVKKSPPTPSIFFIEDDNDVVDEEEQGDEIGEESEQELFQKAETFIGNFYEQLKMQREESWKQLQYHLCQKAF